MAAVPTLVLDFDGTLCLGDDPIRIYAQEVGHLLDPAAADRLHEDLDAFLAGRRRVGRAEDGYRAIEILTADADIPAADRDRAYHASRRRLADGEGVIHVPNDIAGFLDDVHAAGARIVLVTNAPETGVLPWLDSVGVATRLDGVIANAGKPIRMLEHMTSLLEQAEATDAPEFLASVGDVWVNDIGPAMAIGARGFLIDRFGSDRGPVTARAATFEQLYPAIVEWARHANAIAH